MATFAELAWGEAVTASRSAQQQVFALSVEVRDANGAVTKLLRARGPIDPTDARLADLLVQDSTEGTWHRGIALVGPRLPPLTPAGRTLARDSTAWTWCGRRPTGDLEVRTWVGTGSEICEECAPPDDKLGPTFVLSMRTGTKPFLTAVPVGEEVVDLWVGRAVVTAYALGVRYVAAVVGDASRSSLQATALTVASLAAEGLCRRDLDLLRDAGNVAVNSLVTATGTLSAGDRSTAVRVQRRIGGPRNRDQQKRETDDRAYEVLIRAEELAATGLKGAQIAERLGYPHGTLRNLMARGRTVRADRAGPSD